MPEDREQRGRHGRGRTDIAQRQELAYRSRRVGGAPGQKPGRAIEALSLRPELRVRLRPG